VSASAVGRLDSCGVCAHTTNAPTASRTISASGLRKSVFHCSALGVSVSFAASLVCGAGAGVAGRGISSTQSGISAV
jgi:hypothetical protein